MSILRGVLSSILLYQLCSSSQPEVKIHQGRLRGLYTNTVTGRRFSTFLGVPYAKPPVGKHRFKEPVEADPWLGVYNATKKPPACLQLDHLQMNTPFEILGSEDCLYINVYTPKLTTENDDQKALDVIAFVHGGAFMFFESTGMGPSILLDRDVVLVTFNYRLGPLGFISTGDSAAPGNNGMKDQVLALKWIQENIAAFGGDPKSVTISGFSAGGASVHYHLLSPLSRGLFKSVISASGTAMNPWTIVENSREKALYVARQLGCPTEDTHSVMKCLRNRPAEHIVGITKHFLPWLYNPFSPYALVVEPPGPNAFLTDLPINIIKTGAASDVPILFTFTKDEGLYPGAEIVSNPENLNALKNRWNELLPHLLDYNFTVPSDKNKDEISQKIKEYYDINLDTKEGGKNLIKAMTDRLFVHGIAKSVKLHASLYSSPVYLYRFSYSGKYTISTLFGGGKHLGVSHVDDLLYILFYHDMNPYEDESDKKVSEEMVNLWLSFAANGTLDGQTVGQNLPKITFTDIQGPNTLVTTEVDELGEEKFWDLLDLKENIQMSHPSHNEL